MKKTVEQLMVEISPLILNYPWRDAVMYGHWLSQQYYIVRHSTPMLALSCGRSIDNPTYHRRCIEHLAEEKGHDRMLLNDLKILGRPLEAELPATRAFYGSQYYQIEHVNPVSFLGYILFLEALAITFGKETLAKASTTTKALTFLKLHAEEDEGHLESAYQIISGLPPGDQKAIVENLKMSARSYEAMLQDLHALGSVQTHSKKKAA
ncbi:MAG: iron-containing redox enzyme family protein [Pseudobdellovibrionaceae bacterium]